VPANRPYVALLVGYIPTDPSNPVKQLYQFLVETIDGANVIGSQFITVNRPLTNAEITGYAKLFQLALNRAVS